MKKVNSKTALTWLVFGAFFAGASTLFVRISDLGPLSSAFYRTFLAIPFLGLWVSWDKSRGHIKSLKISHVDTWIIVFGGIFFAGDLIFWHLSIIYTSIVNATLLATLAPIYVIAVMFCFFGEKPTLIFVLGLGVTIFGVITLIGGELIFKPEQLFGNICGLITGGFFAGYLIAISRIRSHLPTSLIMYYSTIITAMVLLPIALYVEGNLLPQGIYGWVILLALAIFSHVCGQGLIAYALAYLPTSFSSITLILEVVSATFLGWFFLSETIAPLQWFGGIIIICGIVVARRGS